MLLWATVKPFRVSLVEPVAYLSDSYRAVVRNYQAPTCTLGRTCQSHLSCAVVACAPNSVEAYSNWPFCRGASGENDM